VPEVPDAYGDVGRHPDYKPVPGLLLLRLEAPLFYANASLVTGQVKRLAGAEEPPPRAVILDIGANGRLDITSCEKLAELVSELRSAGIQLALAEVRAPAIEHARRAGLLGDIGEDRVFHTIDEAVDTLRPG
jgi:sulfate permease, SulP family